MSAKGTIRLSEAFEAIGRKAFPETWDGKETDAAARPDVARAEMEAHLVGWLLANHGDPLPSCAKQKKRIPLHETQDARWLRASEACQVALAIICNESVPNPGDCPLSRDELTDLEREAETISAPHSARKRRAEHVASVLQRELVGSPPKDHGDAVGCYDQNLKRVRPRYWHGNDGLARLKTAVREVGKGFEVDYEGLRLVAHQTQESDTDKISMPLRFWFGNALNRTTTSATLVAKSRTPENSGPTNRKIRKGDIYFKAGEDLERMVAKGKSRQVALTGLYKSLKNEGKITVNFDSFRRSVDRAVKGR